MFQGTHCTGKIGKKKKKIGKKKIPVRENTGNLEIFQNTGKTKGIWFAQVVNSLILNFFEAGYVL